MEVDEELKVGDIVRLKSGGPKMTVVSVEEDINGSALRETSLLVVGCQWFAGDKLDTGYFHAPFLVVVERGTNEIPSGYRPLIETRGRRY